MSDTSGGCGAVISVKSLSIVRGEDVCDWLETCAKQFAGQYPSERNPSRAAANELRALRRAVAET